MLCADGAKTVMASSAWYILCTSPWLVAEIQNKVAAEDNSMGELIDQSDHRQFSKRRMDHVCTTYSFSLLSSFGASHWELPLPPEQSGASKSEDKGAKLTRADETFIKDAAAGGMKEVELGKIAADKGVNDKVKEFGRRMQQDHGKANEELKQIAADKGVKIPTKLEGKHKKTVDRLSKLSGAEFDRQYIRTMIEGHKEDIEKFQREAD